MDAPSTRCYYEKSGRLVAWFMTIGISLLIPIGHLLYADAGVSQFLVLPFDLIFVGIVIYSTIPGTRLVVKITQSGVCVQNKNWNRYEYIWDEVESITWGYPEAAALTEVAVLTTITGERIPLHALYAPNQWTRPNNRTSQNMTAEIAQLLAIARENGNQLPVNYLEPGAVLPDSGEPVS